MSQDIFTVPLPMEGYSQPNSKTCWYACYAMMYAWNNKTVAELDQNLVKVGYDLSEIKNRGLEDYEYGKVAHAVGTRDVLRISALNWTIDDVIHRLKRWGPIFMCTMELGGGHAMVLYGVDIKLSNLLVADPYSTGAEYGSAHKEYFSLTKFRGTIQPVDYALQVF